MVDKRRQQSIEFYLQNKAQVLNILNSRNRPVNRERIKTNKKVAALTVDFCNFSWNLFRYRKILFFLLAGLKCTFFVCGRFFTRWIGKLCIKMMYLLGFEIMNHSVSHLCFSKLSLDEQKKEVLDNAEAIRKITGKCPSLFRFPYGDYGKESLSLLYEQRIISIAWDVDTFDWKRERTNSETYHTIIDRVKPGSVILCHFFGRGFGGILKAVKELKKQGWQFVTVTQLLAMEDKEP